MSKKIKRIIISLIGATCISIFFSLDVFIQVANRLDDEIYLQSGTANADIIIIGMDNESISAYGSMPWDRTIMAQAVEQLNIDEENKPAVIGIDTLYTSHSNEQSDASLVSAVKSGGNVVLASSIFFGNEMIANSEEFYMDDYIAVSIEEPISELNSAAKAGHANAMFDVDGILRHAIGDVLLPSGEYYPSFNSVIYSEYMNYIGEEKINTPPVDSDGRWYLPYTSKPGAYDDGFSIVDLINGELDPKLFKGKIVLIGPYAMEMNDEYTTSIDYSQKMFGVEYQANAINSLIIGNFKTEISNTLQQVLLFVVSFLCLLWFYERKMISATISFLLIICTWIASCVMLWNYGYIMHVFYIAASIVICFLVSLSVNYLGSTLDRVRITNSFKRYIEPQIVSRLIESEKAEPSIGGELTQIAVVFADIRGFTSLSESLSTEMVAKILNQYLSLMSECIFNHGGTLDKFMGDCTMAFWGAPLKQEDIAYKAVCAAVEIADKSKALNNDVMQKYSHTIGVGIGINYGNAIVGNFGSSKRMDYTAIGDTVNVAARLEEKAPSGKILISKQTAELLNSRVELKPLGSKVNLKGKSKQVEVFEVVKIL